MSSENIKLTITLSSPQLKEEKIQIDTKNMLSAIKEFDGVQEANLMPIENAEPGAKSIGGFIVGILTAEINAKNLKALVGYLGDRLYGKTLKIKIKIKHNGKELEVEIEGRNAEDLNKEYEKVKPIIEKVVNS